jgi:hypothetical protein
LLSNQEKQFVIKRPVIEIMNEDKKELKEIERFYMENNAGK